MFGIYIEQVEGRLGNRPQVPRGSRIVLRAVRGQLRIFITDFYFIVNSKSLCHLHVLNIGEV